MTPVQAQAVHDERREAEPDHDRVSCWCCCWTCDFEQGPDGDVTSGPDAVRSDGEVKFLVKWEEPPFSPRGRRGKKWQEEAAELRSRPGQWGVLKEYPLQEKSRAYDLAVNVKQGRIVAFRPSGTFEASVRRDGTVHKVYARYVASATRQDSR